MEYFDENIIISMIEKMLPKFSSANIVLTFGIDFNWSHYSEDGENDKHFRKTILVAIHNPSNYTKVMIKDLGNKSAGNILHNLAEIEFDLQSDHDSCWRSDGFRFFFNTWLEAEKYFRKYNIEIRDKRQVSCHCSFDNFMGTPKVWAVKMPKFIDRESRKVNIQFLNQKKLVPANKD